MNGNPKVSVLMSVFNGERYLGEAVRSVLKQTFSDFEFVIINDGSTDSTHTILEYWAARDSRIVLIKQACAGLTKSLNRGIEKARGQYIARMDADDISMPNRLKVQVEFLSNNPDIVALGSAVCYIDERGRRMFTRRYPLTHSEIAYAHLCGYGGFVNHSSVMLRKHILDKVNGYDERFLKSQDYDLWMRLAKCGRLENLDCTLLWYRYHASAISQSCSENQSRFVEEVLNRELKNNGLETVQKLDDRHYIFPNDTHWLLERASSEGFVQTSILCAFKILSSAIRQILFCGRKIVLSLLRACCYANRSGIQI